MEYAATVGWAAVALALLLANPVLAGGMHKLGKRTVAGSTTLTPHKVHIVAVGDTQSLVNVERNIPGLIPSISDCRVSNNCTAECNKHAMCDVSWLSTNARLVQQQVRSILFPGAALDYTGLVGRETAFGAKERPEYNAAPHNKPDVVVFLGDMTDTADFSPTCNSVIATGPNNQWERFRSGYLEPMKAAGIPVIMTHGNHDDSCRFRNEYYEWAKLQSWFHIGHEEDFDVVIDGATTLMKVSAFMALVPTPAGPICFAVHGNWYRHTTCTDTDSCSTPTVTDNTEQFFMDNMGCGAGYPTIVVSHSSSPTAAGGWTSNTHAGDIDFSDVFMSLRGHNIVTTVASILPTVPSQATFDSAGYLNVMCNWQEAPRQYSANTPYGDTTHDGAGGTYCAIELNPDNEQITVRAWDPFHQTQGRCAQCFTDNLKNATFNFDWVARFGALP